ncbi:hypothetical protein [Undibacterium sp. Ji49W]|uniref:hypothetical protein n=1 Tax=Undibacterium sp. Ji49W TaxID=3413040 RepID=UPI003BF3E44A
MSEANSRVRNQWGIHAAAATGAFLLGFGDLLRGGSDSTYVTVLRIADVLRIYFSSYLGQGWVALVFLCIIGGLLSYFYQPSSKKESFSLGMSVFALLTAASPYHPPKSVEQSAAQLINFISTAYAQETVELKKLDFYLEFVGGNRKQDVIVSLYNKDESQLLERQHVTNGDIMKLSYPRGYYILYAECKGCKRVGVGLDFTESIQATQIELAESGVPLSLQRLFKPSIAGSTDLFKRDAQELAKKYRSKEK